MVNASLVAMEFNALLPEKQRPEHTEGYEGFFMLDKISGTVEEASMTYIIRDHDHALFEEKKARISSIAEELNRRYGDDVCQVEVHDQYHNMLDVMKDHMHLIEQAFDAIRELGYEPQSFPIRGGTDGAMLTEAGLPCPNLCTGGYNFHSRYEYASLPEMERSAEVLIRLAKL
jgi:tripeptide aminopeptidase